MTDFNVELDFPPTQLVTDLDGTFIPLPGHSEHLEALEVFRHQRSASSFGLVFCTGRHFSSTLEAIEEYNLPTPDWIICDVGTSIYKKDESGFSAYPAYQEHLSARIGAQNRIDVQTLLQPIEHLALQCDAHQGKFKISFECETRHTDALVAEAARRLKESRLPYEVHGSIDPFLDCGLIDVLPRGVSKAYAVTWLATHADFTPDEVIYAGDSGNDLTALTAGFRAILVANHSNGLDLLVKERLGALSDRLLYSSRKTATSGVLEGCRHFVLFV